MKISKSLLVALSLAGMTTFAIAAGLYPDFPVVGGASYCAGTSNSATGTIIGLVTGCPNTVPAGPTIVTGNEQIPADTRLSSGVNPQTVLLSLASLNALPITVSTANQTTNTISAANNSGGEFLPAAGTITTVNLSLPASPIDGQQYALSSNRSITTLSISAGTGGVGAIIAPNSNPTAMTASLTAPQGYRFLYNAASNSWVRLQ